MTDAERDALVEAIVTRLEFPPRDIGVVCPHCRQLQVYRLTATPHGAELRRRQRTEAPVPDPADVPRGTPLANKSADG